MKKLMILAIATIYFVILPVKAWGQPIAAQSATISYNSETDGYDFQNTAIKKIVIKRILEKYDSPLQEMTDSFIQNCNNYNLDCYLLPSITGLESTFGRFVYPNSYNPFGWGGGYIKFANWDQAITTVAAGLRENYINKGATTVEQIAPIYAESKTWAPRVNYFKNIFENEESKIKLLLSQNEVKL